MVNSYNWGQREVGGRGKPWEGRGLGGQHGGLGSGEEVASGEATRKPFIKAGGEEGVWKEGKKIGKAIMTGKSQGGKKKGT